MITAENEIAISLRAYCDALAALNDAAHVLEQVQDTMANHLGEIPTDGDVDDHVRILYGAAITVELLAARLRSSFVLLDEEIARGRDS